MAHIVIAWILQLDAPKTTRVVYIRYAFHFLPPPSRPENDLSLPPLPRTQYVSDNYFYPTFVEFIETTKGNKSRKSNNYKILKLDSVQKDPNATRRESSKPEGLLEEHNTYGATGGRFDKKIHIKH